MKEIVYSASTQKDIEAFPSMAKQHIAELLGMLAEGLELQPADFKYMSTIGMGAYELRVKAGRQYRVIYVAKFEGAIYVLHAFVKKTQETSQKDIEKAKERYKALLRYQEGKKHE